MDKLALVLPGASDVPSQRLGSPSGIPAALGGDINSSGAVLFQTGVAWLLYIVVALAIAVMMWGGIQWITSSGDPEKLSAAKKKLTFAVIGLVIAISAFFIVRVIITILGGQTSGFQFGNAFGLSGQASSSAVLRSPSP